ncbi:MAG: penicillin-binding protein [Campylobacteraceae bacterium 4484_166]|nr:MAG: penicillin-binding protein [Campylobacteraceae bacterium 4484_166]
MKYLSIIAIFVAITIASWLFTVYLNINYELDELINYKPRTSTQFYDRNGKHIANSFDERHRLYVKFDKIPTRVIESLIAIEDTQYFEHNGINPEAIFRAVLKDIKAMKFVEGASTITQQLVKTVLLSRDKKIKRKAKELFLALELENRLTKEQILERYFNHVYFGHGYYGIKTASYGYFKKSLNDLSLKEIAMLVGLPKAPSFYDPTKNYKHNISRANQVIRRLKTLGWISKVEYKRAIKSMPSVYDDTLTLNKAPYVVDYAIKLMQDMGYKDVKTGGYKVKLSIDLETQDIARESLRYGYDKIIKRDRFHGKKRSKTEDINGAIVVLENSTGKILALVGGVDYKASSFNRAVQSKRQPGSSFKPFVYQVALNQGYSTASTLVDISRTYGQGATSWTPKNYGNRQKGLVRLNDALIHSRNLATINLAYDIGLPTIFKNLKIFDFEGIPRNLSIVLGSFGISPLELSEKYTIFSNKGVMNEVYMIEKIVSKDGKVKEFLPIKTDINNENQAYLLTSMLSDVVQKGTGRRARVPGIQIAGKTGTTNNNVDAWFCGFSPSIQAVVWYGNDDNTPMPRSETGGTTAAPVVSHFFRNWLAKNPNTKRYFSRPSGVFTRQFAGGNYYFTNQSNVPYEDINPDIFKNGKDDGLSPVLF